MWVHKKWVEIKKAANEREIAREKERKDLEEQRIRAEIEGRLELERNPSLRAVLSDHEQAGGSHQSDKPAVINVDMS